VLKGLLTNPAAASKNLAMSETDDQGALRQNGERY
jgi:hypothetical protein